MSRDLLSNLTVKSSMQSLTSLRNVFLWCCWRRKCQSHNSLFMKSENRMRIDWKKRLIDCFFSNQQRIFRCLLCFFLTLSFKLSLLLTASLTAILTLFLSICLFVSKFLRVSFIFFHVFASSFQSIKRLTLFKYEHSKYQCFWLYTHDNINLLSFRNNIFLLDLNLFSRLDLLFSLLFSSAAKVELNANTFSFLVFFKRMLWRNFSITIKS